jgi:hypothetical protein
MYKSWKRKLVGTFSFDQLVAGNENGFQTETTGKPIQLLEL